MLRENPKLKDDINCIIFDEAHCITLWGCMAFRPEYNEVKRFRFLLPKVRFVFASATFTPAILSDIKTKFGLTAGNHVHIRRSNDRPNVHITVRKMEHAVSSYKDLSFLVPDGWKEGDGEPPKFIVFFATVAEAVDAGEFLRRRLPPEYRDKIGWYHSQMSPRWKDSAVEMLRRGEIWGLCATDSFGMVRHL